MDSRTKNQAIELQLKLLETTEKKEIELLNPLTPIDVHVRQLLVWV